MRIVKIINGTYGQRLHGHTVTVRLGETCQVDDQEAARLVGLEVAAYIENNPASTLSPNEPEESGGEETDPERSLENEFFSREGLDDMTRDSLITVAARLGLKVHARMNKADILQVIHGALNQADESTPPDLSPEDPVE